MKTLRLTVAAGCLAALAPLAAAQTGPGLMLQPWQDGMLAESHFEALVFDSGETDAADEFDLIWYEGAARFRLDPDDDRRLTFGAAFNQLDLDSDDARLPDRLTDQRIGVGLRLGEWEGWSIDLTAGAGFAGDLPYADEDAWYAHASLIGRKPIDEQSNWLVVLNFDGNRAIFPDVPLPAVAYQRQASEQLAYTVGLPFSSILWRPIEPLIIDVRYSVPFSVDATVTYAFSEQWRVYGGFYNEHEAYHLDGDDEHRRLFFEQRRLEAGVHWAPCDEAEIKLAGGYAFDQEFTRGFDVTDEDDVADPSDEPYLRVSVDVRF
jgi:hypothetical protein